MLFKTRIIETRRLKMLYPFHPARGQIGRGPKAGHIAHDFIADVCGLKGDLKLPVFLARHRVKLSAHFPIIRPAPLHHMLGLREARAEGVIGGEVQPYSAAKGTIVTLSPQPQASVWFGFLKVKREAITSTS